MSVTLQMTNLLSDSFNESVLKSSMVLDPLVNQEAMSNQINKAISYMIAYIQEKDDALSNMFFIVKIIILISVPVIMIFLVVFEIKEINDNYIMIYKCLTSLPKNVVSAIADSLKSMKSEHTETSTQHTEQDSEMNKQEENLVKIFATSDDNSASKLGSYILMIICTIVSIAIIYLSVLQMDSLFTEMAELISEASPNMNKIIGAFSYQFSLIYVILCLGSEYLGYPIHTMEKSDIEVKLEPLIRVSAQYYSTVRFGDGKEPFMQFHDTIQIRNNLHTCPSEQTQTVPSTIIEMFECAPYETIYHVVPVIAQSLIQPYFQNNDPFSTTNEIINVLWHTETSILYDKFFFPIFQSVFTEVYTNINTNVSTCKKLVVVLFIVLLIAECISIIINMRMNVKMHFALKFLLHCQPSTVTQIPLIANVLSGNFKKQKGDSSIKNRMFFDQVLVQLPDPLIITDETGCISKVNEQGERLFPMNNLIGMKMSAFMNLPMFENSFSLLKKQAPQEEDVVYTDESNTKFNLHIQSLQFNQTTAYLIRDITQTVRYNTLIQEEKDKSDRLLESILPSKLVKRVQQGEKNISFSVQSASVVFMDIVSFTPWCGSLPANRVMEILNLLYKEFDALVAKYPTLTKIKCIGDCYMAAAGIFAEINQPAVHAKEMVSFGIDAIHAVGDVNKQTGQSLQIRVGINTGGPLVAGVLGSGKPTFEILGPTINMAQQMEHHGVPMQVHISRAVYELIYGGEFQVKERGQIEIKNGTVVTYLVSPN
jgi:class 3 adenylate cyclase